MRGATVAAMGLLMVGCGSGLRSSSSSSTTTTRVPSSASTTFATPSGPGYAAARQQWIGAGLVMSSAAQNTALALAVLDLEHGETADTGNRSQYPAVIAAIEDIERLPITGVSAAQSAQFTADEATVTAFFDVPSLVSCMPVEDTDTDQAATEWLSEPDNTSSGVVIGPLVAAANDLQEAERADPSATGCYPAAIDDLQGLESASPADIAGSAASGDNHADTPSGAEIAYLNVFFTSNESASSQTAEPLTEPCPSC